MLRDYPVGQRGLDDDDALGLCDDDGDEWAGEVCIKDNVDSLSWFGERRND